MRYWMSVFGCDVNTTGIVPFKLSGQNKVTIFLCATEPAISSLKPGETWRFYWSVDFTLEQAKQFQDNLQLQIDRLEAFHR